MSSTGCSCARNEDFPAKVCVREEPIDTTTVDGIPVTSPVRTLIDVAAVTSPTEFEDTLDLALVTGVVRRFEQ